METASPLTLTLSPGGEREFASVLPLPLGERPAPLPFAGTGEGPALGR
jgi:hypothetical protein